MQVIQAKAVEALKEVPASVLTQLFGGTDVPIDYFRAVRIRDKLAETAERKLFGGYSGAAGAWDSIVRAYEKNGERVTDHNTICLLAGEPGAGCRFPPLAVPAPGDWYRLLALSTCRPVLSLPPTLPVAGVFVGEAAQTLVQHVDYEIPYLRRQATKLHGAITEAERKQADYVKQAAACSAAYKKVRPVEWCNTCGGGQCRCGPRLPCQCKGGLRERSAVLVSPSPTRSLHPVACRSAPS